MNLCIDIGNTSEKLSVFENKKQIHFGRYECIDDEVIKDVFATFPIANCIISSTKIIRRELLNDLEARVKLMVLDHLTPLPITIEYETPETLGRDRIAAAVAANYLYSHQNNVIVDAGTCITFDFINDKACFLGGNISPGIEMRLKAMHHYTARLPMVEIQYHEEILGKSTTMALQNGAVRGAIWEFSAFIQDIFDKFGQHNIILTGGNAKMFEDQVKNKIFAHSNLVHVGLNEILYHNS